MSVKFKKVFYKNFLATGDMGITINLDSGMSTLIVGENGSGKSTILDALSFALYGKGFRNVTKAQLINSINDKDCRIELDFETGGKSYKVVRGMKPNKFEIYQDGSLINQDASAKDYQSYLETNILKMNEKSFRQIVVLGSADFVPFMQLKAQDRRSIIEDLLDINVFSEMNKILKEGISSLKVDVAEAEHDVRYAKQEVDLHELHTAKDSERTQKQVEQIKETQKNRERDIASLEDSKKLLLIERKKFEINEQQLQQNKKKISNIGIMRAKAEVKIEAFKKEQNYFVSNNSCSTCKQSICEEHKTDILASIAAEKEKIDDAHKKLTEMMKTLGECVSQDEAKKLERDSIDAKIRRTEEAISLNRSMNTNDEQTIKSILNEATSVGVPEKSLLDKKLKDAEDKYNTLKSSLVDHTVVSGILKDDGIKTRIIQQYLPIMNQLINKYLNMLGLSVDFNLDEKFDETIKSRHRDTFSYASFSEGEKARIDLSIMLTWREIAKLKNSANTNLLILDETFDGSLDVTATDELINILNGIEKSTNVFVISHRNDSLYDKFSKLIEFQKVNNFSQMNIT